MAPIPRPPIERFMEKVKKLDSGCHEWAAYRGENGYGRFYFEGKGALAHRWSYEFHVGPVPDGLVIDHLCRNRGCVNPDHLEPVTASENVVRGIGPTVAAARYQAMTHCLKGHPYTEDNIYRDSKSRTCLTCKRAKAREYYERNRDRTIERSREWRETNLDRSREIARETARRRRAKMKNAEVN